jgi:hypothetical protein
MSAVQLLAATQGGSDPAPTRTTGLADCTGLAWRQTEPATDRSPLGSGRRGFDDSVSPERGEILGGISQRTVSFQFSHFPEKHNAALAEYLG